MPSCQGHLLSYSPVSTVPGRRRSKAVAENTQGFFLVSSRLSSGAVLNVRLGRPHCRREDDRCPKVMPRRHRSTEKDGKREYRESLFSLSALCLRCLCGYFFCPKACRSDLALREVGDLGRK